MFESYYNNDDRIIRQRRCWCGNPVEGSADTCQSCIDKQRGKLYADADNMITENRTIHELSPWNGFYSRLMAECRELGIKPWGDGHPASWAAAQYHEWKAARVRQDEGWYDEVEQDEIPSWLIAVDLQAMVNEGVLTDVGGIEREEQFCEVYTPPYWHKAEMGSWRRPDLESKFHVPPYREAEVNERNRHGQVTSWAVAA